jgi:hypothetical protein
VEAVTCDVTFSMGHGKFLEGPGAFSLALGSGCWRVGSRWLAKDSPRHCLGCTAIRCLKCQGKATLFFIILFP